MNESDSKIIKSKIKASREAEYLAGWQRCQADFSNLRREMEEKKKDWKADGKREILERILPVIDGLELVVKGLKSSLNLEKVPTKKFDPALHEAIGGRGETIVQVIQAGYKLDGKLIRPARVKLGE